MAHIVRKFDAKDRVIAEEQVADAPELMIPGELRSTLNPEQAKSVAAFLAGGLHNRAIISPTLMTPMVVCRNGTGAAGSLARK